MPRSMWSGSVSFGLVNVPVKMYASKTDRQVRFNRLNPETGNRLRQKLVDEVTGDEVSQAEAARGFDVGGSYVVVTDDEMAAVAGSRSETIEIERFVPSEDVDQMYVESTHYLGAGKGGAKAYALLSAAMQRSGVVAIGRLCLRSKERVVSIRPLDDGVLVVDSLAYYDCFNDDGEMVPDLTLATNREIEMATKLIDSMSDRFNHASYRDEYRERLEQLIEAKAAGLEQVEPAAIPTAEPALDLMSALEASLSEVRPAARAELPATR